MKNIKSIIIGFLLATCMFLMMGFGGGLGTTPYDPVYVKIVD